MKKQIGTPKQAQDGKGSAMADMALQTMLNDLAEAKVKIAEAKAENNQLRLKTAELMTRMIQNCCKN